MDTGFVRMIASRYRRAHDRALVLVDDLSDEQLAWRPTPASQTIAWNVGRLVCHSRRLRESLPNVITARSGPPNPGQQDGAPCDEAGRPVAVGKAVLLEEARQAFAAVERVLAAVDASRPQPQRRSDAHVERSVTEEIDAALVDHLAHAHRHLSKIEFLRMLQGLGGAADCC